MKKIIGILILLFISISFASFCYASNYISGRAYVIDGDTISINGEKIRLKCVDTPESNYRRKTQYCLDNETDCGLLAKQALKFMIKDDRRFVTCEYEKRDMYGRILGLCGKFTTKKEKLDPTQTYNYKLISEGYSWYYNGGKECKIFKPVFETSVKNKIGLFNDELGGFKEPKLWRKTRSND